MTLADLRKISIKQQLQIRFTLSNGMECVITSQGVAQVPALKGTPDFNLERELSSAGEFLLEPADAARKNAPLPRKISRTQLAEMAGAAASPSHSHDEHEDD